MSDYSQGFKPAPPPDGELADQYKIIEKHIAYLMNEHGRLVQFAVMPILTFFCWLFFRKRGYNYTENFVMNLYLSAHASLISLLMIPISFLSFSGYFIVSSVAAIMYQIWGYQQFFKVSWGSVVLKGILIWILTGVTFGLLNLAVAHIIVNIFMDIL